MIFRRWLSTVLLIGKYVRRWWQWMPNGLGLRPNEKTVRHGGLFWFRSHRLFHDASPRRRHGEDEQADGSGAEKDEGRGFGDDVQLLVFADQEGTAETARCKRSIPLNAHAKSSFSALDVSLRL